MLKISLRTLALVVLAVLLTACWPVPQTPAEKAAEEAVQDLGQVTGAFKELAELGQQVQQAQDSGLSDEEAAGQMMEGIMAYGSKMELQEFEKMEAVDLPEGFPSELVYSEGKVIEASDYSNADSVSKHIAIKTTANSKDVKDFYKNLLGATPWKITSQSADAYGASFSAESEDGYNLDVAIDGDQYSQLRTIELDYRK